MIDRLLTEHHLEFLILKGGCSGTSESTHVKMPHCWKSHALAQMKYYMKLGALGSGIHQSFKTLKFPNSFKIRKK